MELILIRHGATAGNLERRYIGQGDDQPLAPEGIRQIQDALSRGRYPRADAVYSSPLKRCLETARLIYPMMVPIRLPSLAELDFGCFEGKNYEQLKEDPAYRRWIDSAGMTAPPGGESGEEFFARLEGGLRQIAADTRRLSVRRPAVVLHGGCIMTLFSRLAEQDREKGEDFYRYQLPCGGGYQAEMDPATLRFSHIRPLF